MPHKTYVIHAPNVQAPGGHAGGHQNGALAQTGPRVTVELAQRLLPLTLVTVPVQFGMVYFMKKRAFLKYVHRVLGAKVK